MNKCIDCGKEIQGKQRCWKCYIAYTRTPEYSQIQSQKLIAYYDRRGRIKGNRSYCIDCDKPITGRARCSSCYKKYVKKEEELNYCTDCKKECGSNATRCQSCAAKEIWLRPGYKENQSKVHIGQICTKETRKRIGEALEGREVFNSTRQKMSTVRKNAWINGKYDEVNFCPQNPTQPEKDTAAILDDLGINYISQYGIKRKNYDFFLPDYNLLIEYDGYHWHNSDLAIEKGWFDNDRFKDKLAADKGFKLIRLIGLPNRELTRNEIMIQLIDHIGAGNAY